jgi:hypothetical protein
MKINLRRADVIKKGIMTYLHVDPLTAKVTVNKFSKPLEELEKETDKLSDKLKTRLKLMEINTRIRSLVGKANANQGISDRLAEREGWALMISSYEGLLQPDLKRAPEEVILGTHQDLLDKPVPDVYNRAPPKSMEVGLISDEMAETYRKEIVALRRKMTDGNEELLNRNMMTQIELTDEEEKTLTDAGII